MHSYYPIFMGGKYEVKPEIEAYFPRICHKYKERNNTGFVEKFVRRFIKNRSQNLICEGLENLKELRQEIPDRKKPVYIHVGRHLSEMDWVEAQYILSANEMPAMISMGDNLCVWPVGGFLRRRGGFLAIRNPERFEKGMPKSTAFRIYREYIHHLVLNEEKDLLIYPEFAKVEVNGNEETKYGRSYSGKLLEFSPLIFSILNSIQKKSERPLMIVPHNASRERVLEDEMFGKLSDMKKKNVPSWKIYLRDFGFLLNPLNHRINGLVEFNFGEPIPVADYKRRDLPELARKNVAKLQTIFPTHLFAYAVQEKKVIVKDEIEESIDKKISFLDDLGVRVNNRDITDIMISVYNHFVMRGIVESKENNVFGIKKPEILNQYSNTLSSIENILAE